MQVQDLNVAQYIVLVAVIAGVTELITRLRAKDYWVAATIVCSVIVGAVFGLTGYYPQVDLGTGIALGFAASGTLKGLAKIGNPTVVSQSSVTSKGDK